MLLWGMPMMVIYKVTVVEVVTQRSFVEIVDMDWTQRQLRIYNCRRSRPLGESCAVGPDVLGSFKLSTERRLLHERWGLLQRRGTRRLTQREVRGERRLMNCTLVVS